LIGQRAAPGGIADATAEVEIRFESAEEQGWRQRGDWCALLDLLKRRLYA